MTDEPEEVNTGQASTARNVVLEREGFQLKLVVIQRAMCGEVGESQTLSPREACGKGHAGSGSWEPCWKPEKSQL